ncbi:hypothetical protein [Solidesulfovibrio carbinolicus]|uniref:hypothetical protein n=1 Tax=Solidesulfovibrio carbinolicus TaxID=296842 RepID=UPI0010129434|nr:hypothetical protein [Solidesulfovibrio carbinolicus]
MDFFSAIENGLPSYDGFGRKISSLSERHAQVAKAFRECAYKGVTGEAPGEDSAMMAGETLPGKGYIPNGCELISLDNRLFDTADLVILFPAPCESSAIERCENDVRCFGLSPAEDAPKPVAEGQEAAVVEAPAQLKIPAKKQPLRAMNSEKFAAA